MAYGTTYGLQFPFEKSPVGKYLGTTQTADEEIRSNLIHLLLTRKGTRYFLPDFGTRLYEFIFEPLDGPTFSDVEAEIRESVGRYMPGILVTNVEIKEATADLEDSNATYVNSEGKREFRVPGLAQKEYTARVKIDYKVTNSAFESSDFVILNI
jgi:phage baseplate assembly protein W